MWGRLNNPCLGKATATMMATNCGGFKDKKEESIRQPVTGNMEQDHWSTVF